MATTPLANDGSYPRFNMAGTVVEDNVAAAAVLDPDIAPNPAPAIAVAIASPPRTRPTQVVAAENKSSANPDSTTSSAIATNIGIVIIS